MDLTPPLVILDGSGQDQRFPKALANGYFRVNETRFEEIVAVCSDYSRLLTFYGTDNRPAGSWQPFFSSDDALVYARILAYNSRTATDTFEFHAALKDAGGQFVRCIRLARKLDRWYRDLDRLHTPGALLLCRRIRHLADRKLANWMALLQQLYETRANHRRGRSRFRFDSISSIWRHGQLETDLPKTDRDIRNCLKSCFYQFHNGAVWLQEIARELLANALKSQTHSPDTGLFLAFVRLLDTVRNAQNRFTENHLNFYYDRVLGCRPAGPVTDMAHLTFRPAPDDNGIWVPEGTGFEATSDTGKRLYVSERNLLITRARVTGLKTLFFETDPLISPTADLHMVTSAQIRNIPVPKADMPPHELKRLKAWPLLGETDNPALYPASENAPLGFAVASPLLMLREGDRRVTMTLALENREDPDETAVFEPFLTGVSQKIDITPELLLHQVLSRLFTIRLSTAKGWLTVTDITTAIQRQDPGLMPDEFAVTFTLSREAAPIVPVSPKIHGNGYDTPFPVMALFLNPEASIYPLSLLAAYVIRKIRLSVSVRGVRNLVLYNDLGRLDPNNRFQPFGPLPDLGAHFMVGSHEAAVKPLSRFAVHLHWTGLPRAKGGFEAYYQAYDIDRRNDAFKTDLSLLREGTWEPWSADIRLFEADDTGEKTVSPHIVLAASRLDSSRLQPSRVSEADFRYDRFTRSGFFRFTLASPEGAFGHAAYPRIMTRVLTENNRRKRFQKPLPLPNPAYTPQADKIWTDYEAGCTIGMEDRRNAAVFSIHPYGTVRCFPVPHPEPVPLVPCYHEQGLGNLFIGLNDLAPGRRLSLLFRLKEKSVAVPQRGIPRTDWYYLRSGRWKAFETFRVISDTTAGFLKTGIVTLDLPRDMDTGTSLFSDDRSWIRACASRELKIRSDLIAVHAHGMSVRLKNPADFKGEQAPQTIGPALPGIPGLEKPNQPDPSFGGRPDEPPRQHRIRISERLRHKRRAITPWDYERLILGEFPQLVKVKCFPNIQPDAWQCWETRQFCVNAKNWHCRSCGNHHRTYQPGHLLVAVVCRRPDSADKTFLRPKAGPLLLARIKQFLSGLSSPFARINVRNPVYERIQVRCRVKFSDPENPERHIRELNRLIFRYLSPWEETGMPLSFGWRIKRPDIMAYIRKQKTVDFLTDFSMLRIVGNGLGKFELFDSVPDATEIVPKYPWSIAVPALRHFITFTRDLKTVPPEKTGVDELEIGDNFIITG